MERNIFRLLLALALFFGTTQPQTTKATTNEETIDELVVIGSQIKNANMAKRLPITSLSQEDIDIIAPNTLDELLRSIPQFDSVKFNHSASAVFGINAARGDVSSINLRNLGTGYTLLLINGRRAVMHSGSQTEKGIPTMTQNANAIASYALKRLEVLQDGASALYGSDAMAGIVNYVLDDDLDYKKARALYGTSRSASLDVLSFDIAFSAKSNNNRTRLSVIANNYHKDHLLTSERAYARSSDLRPLVPEKWRANPRNFDNRHSAAWGRVTFQGDGVPSGLQNDPGTDRNESLTTNIHLRPLTYTKNDGTQAQASDCSARLRAKGTSNSDDLQVCLGRGRPDRALYSDLNSANQRALSPKTERENLFISFIQELDVSELYTEFGYYHARTEHSRDSSTNSSRSRAGLQAAADYYWNPYGPDGADQTIASTNQGQGTAFNIYSLLPIDVGVRNVSVEDTSFRALLGWRGEKGLWDFDGALLYSNAKTSDDTKNRISLTALRKELQRTDEKAYNIFSGLDPDNFSAQTDPTPNNDAALERIRIPNLNRTNETSLRLADFKFSRNNLFATKAGHAGFAAGIEYREEELKEDRDPRLDGTIKFTDGAETNPTIFSNGDVMGSSPSPDIQGTRKVFSGFLELDVPLAKDQPLIHRLDLQLAGRVEDYSDIGAARKPKIALSYHPVRHIQLRSAYSESFHAPNLLLLNLKNLSFTYTLYDYIKPDGECFPKLAGSERCGGITGFVKNTRGNKNLEPVESENITFGITYTYSENFIVTFDVWDMTQTGFVWSLSTEQAVEKRLYSLFDDPENPTMMTTDFVNLGERQLSGFDLSIQYKHNFSNWGDLTGKLNLAYLDTFHQVPDSETRALIEANPVSFLARDFGDLVGKDGAPRTKANLSLTWEKQGWMVNLFAKYIGELYDVSANDGEAFFRVDDHLTIDIFTRYRFSERTMKGIALRGGIKNIFDQDPPLADEPYGYFASIHSPYGRYIYMMLDKQF